MLELKAPDAPQVEVSSQDLASEDSLPPRDGGRAAWTALAAVSMIITVTWGKSHYLRISTFNSLRRNSGFGSSSGIFREYYFNHPPLVGNQLVASIGVLIVVCSSLRNMGARAKKKHVGNSTDHVTVSTALP